MSTGSTKKRGLSENFIKSFINGILAPVLECVRVDSVLDLQIRENYVNIYYRGGNIMRIKETKEIFIPHFERKYLHKYTTKINRLPGLLKNRCDVRAWVNSLPYLKHEMDLWFGAHPKNEREFQQLVVRENNYSNIAKSTDYFIIDIEYDNRKGDSSKKGARFDLVAIKWESDPISRKLQKGYKPILSFIEMKYGDTALKEKSGILAHIDDFKAFSETASNIKEIKHEMVEIFQQKRDLGLISGLEGKRNKLKNFSEEIEYIFLIANHDPAKTTLNYLMDDISEKNDQNQINFNIKFCSSNFMGYGLYKENIVDTNTFIKKFRKQILSN